jgi:hypothetical protein
VKFDENSEAGSVSMDPSISGSNFGTLMPRFAPISYMPPATTYSSAPQKSYVHIESEPAASGTVAASYNPASRHYMSYNKYITNPDYAKL